MESRCHFPSEMSIFGRPHRPWLLGCLSCANAGPATNARATKSRATAITGDHRFRFILLSFHEVAKRLTSVALLEGYPLGRLGELSYELLYWSGIPVTASPLLYTPSACSFLPCFS